MSRLYIPLDNDLDTPVLKLTVKDKNHYSIVYDDKYMEGEVGTLLNNSGVSLEIESIDAEP